MWQRGKSSRPGVTATLSPSCLLPQQQGIHGRPISLLLVPPKQGINGRLIISLLLAVAAPVSSISRHLSSHACLPVVTVLLLWVLLLVVVLLWSFAVMWRVTKKAVAAQIDIPPQVCVFSMHLVFLLSAQCVFVLFFQCHLVFFACFRLFFLPPLRHSEGYKSGPLGPFLRVHLS